MKSTSKIFIVSALMCVSTIAAYSQDCESYLQQASEMVSQKKYCEAKEYYLMYSKCDDEADVSMEIARCELLCVKDTINESAPSTVVNTFPDIISMKDGEEILALVQKISETGVTYRLFAYPNGPRYTIEKSEIYTIRYANGSMDVFSDVPLPLSQEPPPVEPTKSAIHPVIRVYPSFYLALTAGASTFGTVSFAGITKGGPSIFGADFAYFFNSWLGMGLKMNAGICNVDIGASNTYSDIVTFIGPSLYSRLGKGAFAFTIGAGGGLLYWKWEIQHEDSNVLLSAGGFLSAGFNYMLTRNFGIGLNVQSVFGSAGDSEQRKPAGIGGSMGINFRF